MSRRPLAAHNIMLLAGWTLDFDDITLRIAHMHNFQEICSHLHVCISIWDEVFSIMDGSCETMQYIYSTDPSQR